MYMKVFIRTKGMKKNLLFLWMFLFFAIFFCLNSAKLYAQNSKIDINTATLDQIRYLPISEQQAEDIWEYRTYVAFFKSIYQLREIKSIDQKTLNRLKPFIIVSHYSEKDEVDQRRDEIYYLIQRLGSNEGFQEGMSDIWEDYLITPKNVNKMMFSDILNMPNVSPIDAYSIMVRRAARDTLTSYRDLRKTEGISHYGASNLRHYVYYKDQPIKNKLFVDYQFKYNDSPYSEEAETMYKESFIRTMDSGGNINNPREKIQSFWGYFNMEDTTPALMHKFRIRFDNQWRAGLMYNSRKGEDSAINSDAETIFKDAKYFGGYEDFILPDHYMKVYVGNFRATFGEGLVMENTDFSGARKTGHGFSKRVTGIIGDISRTQEYSLFGTAVEWKHPKFQAALFYSNDDKDAVVYDSNQNGEIDDDDYLYSYVTMTRRFTNEEFEEVEAFYNSINEEENGNSDFNIHIAPRSDAFNEKLIGGHVEYIPFIGTHIGFTGYESRYDRDFVVPEGDDLKSLLIDNIDDYGKFKMMENEIMGSYSTLSSNYDYDRNYRRVLGFDWRTVFNNTSFQGEYAELKVDGNEMKIGDDPSAMIMSTYTQFEDLYFIALYRDYDIDFDNPYSTPFYEHERFDDTIYDKNPYVLNNPLLADLYINSERAQAEKGIYFETRYKMTRTLTINRAYIDVWERKADGRKSIRFQGELDFRPIFQLSLRLKYKHQQNRYHDDADRGVSKTNETTARVISNLSKFDRISLEYRYNTVWMPPYPYLSNDEYPHGAGSYENDSMVTGTNLIHGDYIGVDYTHNFSDNLKFQGSFIYWDGHGISHWDWEDMEIDFMGEQGNKYWLSIHSKIASNLYVSLKYKVKHYKTKEMEWRTWWNTDPQDEDDYNGEVTELTRVDKKENAIRLQIDWKF